MATITIDPVNRIEGHLKVTMTVDNGSGLISGAKCTGNLFRGFELIMNRRDPRDAPQITQRICGVCPTSHGLTSVKCLETALGITNDPGTSDANGDIAGYSTTVPDNGRIIQNIIQGCDLVMSHITHLYHLSALDFINTTAFPGMAPWLPSYTAGDMVDSGTVLGSTLVVHYVQALEKRRKMHTAGALFSGRQPMQNAMVPGGVTTLLSATYPLTPQSGTDYDMYGPFNFSDTKAKFKTLLNDVRTFINTTYIPDVVTVANAFPRFWSQGVGCTNLLAYGDYPVNATGTLAIKRGRVSVLTPSTFDQGQIREYVANSYYNYGILDPAGLHPFDGKTTPNMGSGGYSWLKAPRYMVGTTPTVYEVGPLARMVTTYLSTTQVTADDTVVGGTSLGQALGGPSLGAYSVTALVDTALGLVGQGAPQLYSALGRHAARALEAKYIADLMAGEGGAQAAWVDQINPANPCYTYKKIPKQISTGYGLTEAPRGALGHWIKIEGRKVAKYQCVVPTTWNASPMDALGQNGPAEQALNGSTVGNGNPANYAQVIVDILRLLHPFDFCIACAVHVVNPEGKDMLKFAIGPNGKPTDITVSE
jgi:hydrogenase large subunit